MHRSSVPNRVANSKSPGTRCPFTDRSYATLARGLGEPQYKIIDVPARVFHQFDQIIQLVLIETTHHSPENLGIVFVFRNLFVSAILARTDTFPAKASWA